jgi:hypothetical protein
MSDIQKNIGEARSEILARLTQIEVNSSEISQNIITAKNIDYNKFEFFT